MAKSLHYTVDNPAPSPAPGLLYVGHFIEHPPYRVVRPGGTRDWLLTFTLRGCGLYRQPGVETAARPGDLLLLSPGAYHDYSCPPGRCWEFVWSHFIMRPQWLQHVTWPMLGHGLSRLSISDTLARRRIAAAFRRSYLEFRAGLRGLNHELALNALEEVLLLAARENANAARERPLSQAVRRVIQLLADELTQPHSVASLAHAVRLSPSRLSHRFKIETGDSIIAYLLKLRLQQAARLLEFSGHAVKEVAANVGFDNPFYFSRQFRKHFGHCPREHQQQATKAAALR